MEWRNGSFTPQRPESPPKITVVIEIIKQTHERFGKRTPLFLKPATVDAIADSGCQTCTAGPEILSTLKCPRNYLVASKHRIVGITDSHLDIIGTLFLNVRVGNRVSKQMVYISKNCHGFYLSQTAMKDLDIVKSSFPVSISASSREEQCTCPKRSTTPTKPDKVPFEPTPKNVLKLKEWLLKEFAASAFNQCPHQPLPEMTGKPVKLRFKEESKPHAIHTPIPVPRYWKQEVKADLDRDVRLGIIEKVPQGTTTEWCARMVVTPKKTGKPRRTVDLQQLNKATFRETHHTPSPFDLVSTVPTQSRKTVLDAWNGYHSLALDETTKEATTFITEWGRYRYCRAPMGCHVSGDAYTRRFDDITAGQPRVVRCIDDSLLWDNSIENAFWHTFEYLKLCGENGIVFNKEKFEFAQDSVDFAGFEVTNEGYKPLKKMIDAIQNFPTPRSKTDVRSWFGLVNQLAYTFAQASVMGPFRNLLSSKSFYWDAEMDILFKKSKDEIISLVKEGVKTFVPNRPTCLVTDWSKTGIGFHLTQKHCRCPAPNHPACGKGHWKLVFAGSRFTTDSESRYAPIEGEALAAVYGLQRCRMFLMGAPHVILATDHQPLTRIFNDRELCTIPNPRILKFKEKTLMYSYEIIHMPGKSSVMKIADITSRNPARSDLLQQKDHETAVTSFARFQGDGIGTISWQDVKDNASRDKESTLLANYITEGFPELKNHLPSEIHSFWPMRDDLYLIDGVPFKGKKMLIPKALRAIVLEGLHTAHQGVSSMLANARERFFWPGLDAAIRLYRSQCRQCNEQAPSLQKEPSIETSPPEFPFEQVSMDLCSMSGFSYLIYVDTYSGWIEVANLSSTSFNTINQVLLMYFSTFGVPQELATDGGPPFQSVNYTNFLKRWNIRRRLSSAYYPQSNGRAEAGVKTAKRILLGNVDPTTGKLNNDQAVKALLTHRNTPSQQTGISPATALFGKPIRDHLPLHCLRLRNEWQRIGDKREEALAKRHIYNNHLGGPRQLQPLDIGDSVQIQNQHGTSPTKWNNTGFITAALPNRQYQVVVDGSRRITLRNRRFLRRILPACRKVETVACPPIPELASTPPNTPGEVETNNSPPRVIQDKDLSPRAIQDKANALTKARVETLPREPSVDQPRRSTRVSRPPRPLSPKMFGQSHDD